VPDLCVSGPVIGSRPEHGLEDAEGDDCRRDAAPERDDGSDQHELWVRLHSVHPVAWSTTIAVKGCPPFGVTLKVRPQWPTITSAFALRL